ncbi:MAG: outer membrane protein assembly factor BamE [Hyphomicrobiales bacterium]|nr:outer membrane protein assembly factor BamE [Hyphomicrobiales bacterium]MDE2018200.1 outer membrane protein assembly factor BamE [Hyphomicrobiales bacterium]
MTGRSHAGLAVRAALAAALALGAAPLAGCLGYDGDLHRGYVVDPTVIASIKPGVAKPKVLADMGTPQTTSTIGGDAWYYVSQDLHADLAYQSPKVVKQRVIAVYFKGDKVVRLADYGLKDGRVFDFVARTTPTSGAEEDFLRNIFGALLAF